MNGAGILMFFFIVISAIIVLISFIVLIVKSKYNIKLLKIAWGILIGYIIFVFLILYVPQKRFDSIPGLSIKGGEFIVINEGTGSMGSFATYDYSKENIIKETEKLKYSHYLNEKFGYTFKGVAEGEIYLLILENDCGDLVYADIYQVEVYDDLSLDVSHIENIDIYPEMTNQDFIDYVSDKYGFIKSRLEDKYSIYSER